MKRGAGLASGDLLSCVSGSEVVVVVVSCSCGGFKNANMQIV